MSPAPLPLPSVHIHCQLASSNSESVFKCSLPAHTRDTQMKKINPSSRSALQVWKWGLSVNWATEWGGPEAGSKGGQL